jgi:hypothetical protein
MRARQCGPGRYRMVDRTASALRALDLIVHETRHRTTEDGQHIQTILRGIVEDTGRTMAICDDIAAAAAGGRNSLVLTRWTEHLGDIVANLAEQYVGRVLRPTATKSRVEVHDYVDVNVPQLARMYDERRTAYAALGFNVPRTSTRRSRTTR